MNLKKSWGLGAVAVATLLALPALAQESEAKVYDENQKSGGFTRDFGVSLRGGLNTYTGDLADLTGVGGSLGIMADARPLPLLGLELGYEGSRNPFVNIDGGLWRNNVGALAKVGPEIGRNGSLRPFVGAGFGVSSLNPSGDAEILFDNDFVTEVPLAAGVEYKVGAVKAGVRATYSILGGENLGLDEHGNNVNFGLNLGGSF
jgi:outer membrane protein with beta-barrel domain